MLIRVTSLSAAARYWRDVLKVPMVREDAKFAVFRLPDDKSEVVLHADADLPDNATLILVDSVEDLYKRRDELKLTFHGPPQRATRGFRAVVKDPFGTVLMLIDRTADAVEHDAHERELEDARVAAGVLFAGVEVQTAPRREVLAELYAKIGRTADDLPYTPQFEQLYEAYVRDLPAPEPTRAEVWRHLLTMRKAGKLPRLGAARTPPPSIEPEDRTRLTELLGPDIGRRDRLPYTERFDEIAITFNRGRPRPIPPHVLWRMVATIAK